MDKKILEQLKAKLEEKKQSLISQLGNIGQRAEGAEINFDSTFPQYGDSLEDSASEVADYTKNLSLERDLEKELKDVEKALKQMAEGGYGICGYCGQEIELERLMVRPESGSCVECKKTIKAGN